MAKCGKKCGDSTKAVDRDNFPVETGSQLKLEKEHKDWYHPETMGKQRGKPRFDMKEQKKIGKKR